MTSNLYTGTPTHYSGAALHVCLFTITNNTFSDILVGVRSSASSAVIGRKDYDPMNKHKYAFTIFTSTRYQLCLQ